MVRGHVMPQNLPSPTPSYNKKETQASVEPSRKNDSGLKGRCVCLWRGTSIFQALSQKRGEMETSRYSSSLASGRRSRGTGKPGVSPEWLPSHRGVCRAIRLEGASVPGWVLWAPPLGLPGEEAEKGPAASFLLGLH